jgi:predicted TIM-barrel fold metal-dependent hydrolase
MTFEAYSSAFVADVDNVVEPAHQQRPLFFPKVEEVQDPDAAWASRNPDRLMAFLFVAPRDCAAIDELMAL